MGEKLNFIGIGDCVLQAEDGATAISYILNGLGISKNPDEVILIDTNKLSKINLTWKSYDDVFNTPLDEHRIIVFYFDGSEIYGHRQSLSVTTINNSATELTFSFDLGVLDTFSDRALFVANLLADFARCMTGFFRHAVLACGPELDLSEPDNVDFQKVQELLLADHRTWGVISMQRFPERLALRSR